MAGTTRIGPRRPRFIYLAEWRESRGLTQKQLGERLGVPDMTISRWEKAARGQRGKGTAQMNDDVRAAVAEALDIEPEDLYRHPDTPSADALLRGQDEEMRGNAIAMIETLVARKASAGKR